MKQPVALIAGPTASGKSGLALDLADALCAAGRKAVIINADSVQVYRDIPILSAAPSAAEMEQHPHRLYGAWDGATACSAADWSQKARDQIVAAHSQGTIPILCGGTGLYMRTLLEGIAPVPEIDPEVRAEVRGLSQDEARAALELEDPNAASRLAPADVARTARALEVFRSSGKTLAEWQQHKSGGIGGHVSLHSAVLLPEREWLFDRCNRRFETMLGDGAIAEVELLRTRELDPALPVMRAIGVREIGAWLEGEVSRDEMIQSGQLATRQYAKRQYTWFRNQPPASWHRAESQNVDLRSLFGTLLHF